MLLTLAFLERADFYTYTPGPLVAMRTWNYDDPRFPTLRMEDMVANINGTVGAALIKTLGSQLTVPSVDRFAFDRFAGDRRPGEVNDNSHYRSGLPGQWRRELPAAAITYIRSNQRTVLERFYPQSLVSDSDVAAAISPSVTKPQRLATQVRIGYRRVKRKLDSRD